MKNILYTARVRRKTKFFWDALISRPYYQSEKISFKEKVYTFLYNLERTGVTTKGELDWADRMMRLDIGSWNELCFHFENNYREFETQCR